MNVDPKNPKMEGRDRLVCSKGHAGPAVYSVLAEKGFFPKSELLTLNQGGTSLPSHCDMNKTPGIDMTAGSLGQGFSCAVGIALGSRIKKDGATIYAIIGDGESQEGQIWEAAMSASGFRLGNLVAILDNNHVQMCGPTDEIMCLGSPSKKFEAFGWKVISVDGHDFDQLIRALDSIPNTNDGVPTVIIADTVKGKGVSFMEGKCQWHGGAPDAAQMEQITKELGGGTL